MGGSRQSSMCDFNFLNKGLHPGPPALQVPSGDNWTTREVLRQIFSKIFAQKVICETKLFQCQNDFLKIS